MGVYNAVTDGKSQAGTITFGCKKWIEDFPETLPHPFDALAHHLGKLTIRENSG